MKEPRVNQKAEAEEAETSYLLGSPKFGIVRKKQEETFVALGSEFISLE